VIEPVSVVDAVCEAFTDDLLSGLYEPGQGFTEPALAERYGVARPTAREAIAKLAGQGFLVRERNRTAVYPRLQATDLRELVVVRLALEEAALRAPVRQNEYLERMEEEVHFLRSANGSTLRSSLVKADLSFHRWLVMSAGNDRLSRVYAIAQSDILLSMVQSQSVMGHKHIASEHARILRALQAQDVDLAVRELRSHLGSAVSRMAAALNDEPIR
jgi:DNA-binding GntR family transcriptional regulator